MDLTVCRFAERPDMLGPVQDMPDTWPEFTTQDPVGNAHYGRIPVEFPQHVLFAQDDRGEVVAHAYSVS